MVTLFLLFSNIAVETVNHNVFFGSYGDLTRVIIIPAVDYNVYTFSGTKDYTSE